MAPPKLAVVTMVYNEADYLPIWLAYYGGQVDPSHCYIIDHGSDDGSTDGLTPFNVMRIPRSPLDEVRRATYISEFCASLLLWYDCVLHVDADEIVVADPRYFASLEHYCSETDLPVASAIGMNMIHRAHEAAFDPAQKVLAQREWVFRSSSMCKPALIRRPVVWPPGFHSANSPVAFDRLFMFHLRWFDLPIALRRMAKTRTMARHVATSNDHQQISDDMLREQFRAFGSLPPSEADLDLSTPPVADFCAQVEASQAGRQDQTYRISLDIWADELWRVPARFRDCF